MSTVSSALGPVSDTWRAQLLAWYDESKRPLPWRGTEDPYRIWVAEVMLQQTRVETAIPYYRRFLNTYPTVAALAGASEEDVFALWSGLGYYRRARALLKGARRVVESGGFPKTLEGWLALPGVGRYTAAAVLSIAYRVPLVALDGNLERVLARLEGCLEDPKSAAGRRFLEAAAKPWLDGQRPGDSNQALMEIGSTVCRPRNPRCSECPLRTHCNAYRLGRTEEIPRTRAPKARTKRRLLAAVVRRRDRFLLFRRDSQEAVLAGTWELPWVDQGDPDPTKALARRYGGSWRLGRSRGAVRHAITHRDLEVRIAEAARSGAALIAEGPEARWATLSELADLPHSSLVRKVLEASSSANG